MIINLEAGLILNWISRDKMISKNQNINGIKCYVCTGNDIAMECFNLRQLIKIFFIFIALEKSKMFDIRYLL